MKKYFVLFLLLFATFSASAQRPPSPSSLPPHIELKYYGFYCVVDYVSLMHFSSENGAYMDQYGKMHYFEDIYSLHGITAVAGWQWRKESAVGLGFSYLNDPLGSFSQIPVFVEYRSHFTRSRLTPFTSVQLGYSIPFGSKNKAVEYTRINEGGITFSVLAGLRFAFTHRLGINLNVGYQFIQCRNVERGFNEVAYSLWPEVYNNVRFGIGFNF